MATMQMTVRPEDLSQLPKGAERIPDPGILVIFGASGDLTKRKLLPALFHLWQSKLLPQKFAIVGVARRPLGDEFAADMRSGIVEFGGVDANDPKLSGFVSNISYFPLNFDDPSHYAALKTELDRIATEKGIGPDRLFYLATAPEFFTGIIENLGAQNMAQPEKGRVAIVIEKPFGHDLDSARLLNHQVNAVFHENQVFRIDHYLGKETVQNLLALRFANTWFEPVWNSNFVDSIQITMAEDVGIVGRAGFYDKAGAARDVLQNHLLQLLALTAMEEPVEFDSEALRIEKRKVLRAISLPDDKEHYTVRGQYEQGWLAGERVRGYLDEDGIPTDSTTETYAAVRLGIDTRRWAGVPVYLRTGKRLPRRVTEIAVLFKRAPHLPFAKTDTVELGHNQLVVRVQPDEGVTLRFGSKVPGSAMEVREVSMDFSYGASFTESSPEAYERLLLDVLIGDTTLFPDHHEVEASWNVLDPLEAFWAEHPPQPYRAGAWGPQAADDMLALEVRTWRRP
ncbi:MAG: glucose-6-phosphate dehydrogenase [Terracidiphilus sp.]